MSVSPPPVRRPKSNPVAVEPRPNQIAVNMQNIAWMLDRTYDWVIRNIDALMKDHGFPKPRDMPGQRHWSARRVREWMDQDEGDAIASSGPKRVDYDAILDKRNRQIAGDAA